MIADRLSPERPRNTLAFRPREAGRCSSSPSGEIGQVAAITDYNEGEMRKLEAVYEGGVLRPTEKYKLPLEEHQLVSVVILDAEADEETVEFESPESFQALADHSVSREAVRAALATIPGSLDGDFAAERNER